MHRRREFLGLLAGGYLIGDRWGSLSGGNGASARPPGAQIPRGSVSAGLEDRDPDRKSVV